ncbi:unnamed protein product [Phytophthora lilii]|uniref:Unnamed protein product n=1 Tax=Phytophthora lilii TaxID=2077276 RepID=A0A9W6TVP3_9STRA|nr:unnamed protein product [Phytophthora lilii]
MFSVRSFYTLSLVTFVAIQQFCVHVPVLPYPIKRLIRNAVMIAASCVGINYGIATVVGFPIPFMMLTTTPLWLLLIFITTAVEWGRKIRETPEAITMLANAKNLWGSQILLTITYPTYFYIFTTLSKKGQTVFALLLPVIKLLMKNVYGKTVAHLRDKMPQAVVFNCDVFSALFVSYCMQSSPSIWITLEIIMLDLLMMAISLRGAGSAHRNLKQLEVQIGRKRSWGSLRDRSCTNTKTSSSRLTTNEHAAAFRWKVRDCVGYPLSEALSSSSRCKTCYERAEKAEDKQDECFSRKST